MSQLQKKGKKERGTKHAIFQHCERERNTNRVGGIARHTSLSSTKLEAK